MEKRLWWGENALQGLAHWIGYRKALYEGYHLLEAALVAELCGLVQARRPRKHHLGCELTYSTFLNFPDPTGTLGNSSRVDLALSGSKLVNDNESEFLKNIHIIIEVKRAEANPDLIWKDLRRLYAALKLQKKKGMRAFLFLVSQGKRPEAFVDNDGWSKREVDAIKPEAKKKPIETGWYKVRRTCKSMIEPGAIETANYACMIEVFVDKPEKITKDTNLVRTPGGAVVDTVLGIVDEEELRKTDPRNKRT